MASTYINRAFTSAGNQKIWTLSGWFKRSLKSGTDYIFCYAQTVGGGSSNRGYISFNGTGSSNQNLRLGFNPTGSSWTEYDVQEGSTIMDLRDTHGWYHVVIAVDTTQATATNRIKVYINGVQRDLSGSPSQNFDTGFNANGYTHEFGSYPAGRANGYYDGSMSHLHFIDGTQYQASDFGSTDSTTGEWKINTSPSVTYGTNGFFILKDGNSVTDQSGNSNNFTVAGGTLTNTEDCPSNVFATFNPLIYYGGTRPDFSNGNTAIRANGNGNYGEAVSTLGMPKSGKFYAEFKRYQNDATFAVGVGDMPSIIEALRTNTQIFNTSFSGHCAVRIDGSINRTGQEFSNFFSSGIANGDIVGIAIDLDNGAFYAHKNGTYGAVSSVTGVPTSGSSKTGAIDLSGDSWWTNSSDICFLFGATSGGGWDGCDANFGNGYFGTTAISSEGTNASGIGKFEYDVPTGYTALSTKGLNE